MPYAKIYSTTESYMDPNRGEAHIDTHVFTYRPELATLDPAIIVKVLSTPRMLGFYWRTVTSYVYESDTPGAALSADAFAGLTQFDQGIIMWLQEDVLLLVYSILKQYVLPLPNQWQLGLSGHMQFILE